MINNITSELKHSINTIFDTYINAGYECYLVGGAVRDLLCDISPKDFDFATNAPYEFTREAFSKTIDTGISHGTISVVIDDVVFEITRYRTEKNHDGRHCDIEFASSIYEDLNRRDFTINAMAMDKDGNIIDPFNGQGDLKNNVIKFVGSAEKRIKEDYLRILRYYRFAGRFENSESIPDSEAKIAILRSSHLLYKHVSVERIFSEFKKIITGPRAWDLITEMSCLKILPSRLLYGGGGLVCEKDKFEEVSKHTNNPITLMTLLFGYSTPDILKSMKASNNDVDFSHKVNIIHKYGRDKTMEYLHLVVGYQKDTVVEGAILNNVDYFERSVFAYREFSPFPVNGYDLIKLGMKPGPEYSAVISYLKGIWVENNCDITKEELLKYYIQGKMYHV